VEIVTAEYSETPNLYNITRAQEDTADVTHTAGSKVSLNYTAGVSEDDIDIDYTDVSGNDGNTDVTGAELEELTDGSETTLHIHDYNKYVDRGDPDAYDFEVGDFTTDENWYDLDLSAIVPPNTTLVHLRIWVQNTTANQNFVLRKNGNTNSYNCIKLTTQNADIPFALDLWCPVDSNRVIEYFASNSTWTNINIVIRGWLI